jgi:hypothetical protein
MTGIGQGQNGPGGTQDPGPIPKSSPAGSTIHAHPPHDESEFLPPGSDPENRLLWPFLTHMAEDQMQFWTSPKELKNPRALETFLPFVGFTGALIAGDSWISKQVPDSPSQVKRSKNISNYAVFSLIGAGGGAFAFGKLTHNDHLSETGFLSGEAAINSTLVTYAFKEATRRERPYQGNGNGDFFKGGSSFPSEHAAIAWSIASVVAHEYPGPLSQIGAYGLASTVTLTRVTGKQHFPSDVVVGSALGWYFGRQIYRKRHDPELGGTGWGELVESKPESPRSPENMGSPYVPLDSWVYPGIERLAALGYVQSAHLGIRPWTRMECARLLEEATDRLGDDGSAEDLTAQGIEKALSEEFDAEAARLNGTANLGVSLDSVYTRVTGISGTPLRDGYHFGQTIINDYGRPYGEGINNVTGFSTHAVAGPFAFALRGEYQHAPGSPSDPLYVQQAIANADFTLPVANGAAQVDRFRLIDALVALNFRNVQISFGKQSQWLGLGESGPLLLSDNAEPLLMLKIDSVSPFRIPLLSSVLGPVRTEFFIGQLAGHQFEWLGTTLLGPGNIKPQPYLHGTKISFKPTPNLEFGMGFTAQFVGPGLPFTWGNFARTFFAHTSGATTNNNNPGKRISAADVSYRVPGLRKWLTIYTDSLAVDEYSPIGSSRPSINPGMYMPQVPKLPRLEFRAEFLRADQSHEFPPGFVYFGARRYRSGYTNEGNLLASWIGRAGTGQQGWLTYSFSPRTRLQAGYRRQVVNKNFIEGGQLNDLSAHAEVYLSRYVSFSGLVQYEKWKFPILSPVAQNNVTSSFELTFYPQWRLRK